MKIQALICSLLMITFFSANAFAQCNGQAKAKQVSYNETPDIVGVAASSDDFSTLVAAVKAAKLVKVLQGDGPFTVFAPDNAAFAKLPAGTVESLLEEKNRAQLTKILTYHVVAGKFDASAVVGAIKDNGGKFKITTVSGDQLIASISNGSVVLKDESGNISTVTQTDLNASNGVIHAIDTVVLPK